MKDDKFVMRFSSTSYVFYSLTHNQNDKLHVKVTFLFLQWHVVVSRAARESGMGD